MSWPVSTITPLEAHYSRLQETLRVTASAAGASWEDVWAELKSRGEKVRTGPTLIYSDMVEELRRDILAGRWPV